VGPELASGSRRGVAQPACGCPSRLVLADEISKQHLPHTPIGINGKLAEMTMSLASPVELAVLRALDDDGALWLRDVPNKGPRRQPLYDQHLGIRGTGVYMIRDIEGEPDIFYVGKVVQDRLDPTTTNPNADGIIGRLSGHQNLSGSNVLARWYQHIHPELDIPLKVAAGALRDRIRVEAAPRMRVTYCACPAEIASRVESRVIARGLPRDSVVPILNSPNWRRPR
jgi:hypothetical protein